MNLRPVSHGSLVTFSTPRINQIRRPHPVVKAFRGTGFAIHPPFRGAMRDFSLSHEVKTVMLVNRCVNLRHSKRYYENIKIWL
jgi:hypothetical protein